MRQRVQALRKHWLAAILFMLVVVLDGGSVAAAHGATSMRIIVWSQVTAIVENQPGILPVIPPAKEVFDKTVTDLRLVHDAQDQLDGSPLVLAGGGCTLGSPEYVYQFRFATLGVTTQVYNGQADCIYWSATTLGIPAVGFKDGILADSIGLGTVTLDGTNILDALHEQTGMPIGQAPN